MNVADAKKLRQLTWAHLKRPDPFNWLLAADILEESGMDEEAAKWRWRGESLPALEYAIETRAELRRVTFGHPDPQFALIGCGGRLRPVMVEGLYNSVSLYLMRDAERVLRGGWDGHIVRSTSVYHSEPKERQTKALLEFIDFARLWSEKESAR